MHPKATYAPRGRRAKFLLRNSQERLNPHMPYSNVHQMKARVQKMREIAETVPDPEIKRLILQQADKLEADALAMERGQKVTGEQDRA